MFHRQVRDRAQELRAWSARPEKRKAIRLLAGNYARSKNCFESYGMFERQFRNDYEAADRQRGITGENLLQRLECRLDTVAYRMVWCISF